MNKYFTEFNTSGISTVNVDKICKDWDERFIIYVYNNEKFTFVITGRGRRKKTNFYKTEISKTQAYEIVAKLTLLYVRDSTFRSAGAYHTFEYIKSEVERLSLIKDTKERELSVINSVLENYEKHI